MFFSGNINIYYLFHMFLIFLDLLFLGSSKK